MHNIVKFILKIIEMFLKSIFEKKKKIHKGGGRQYSCFRPK